MNPEVASGMANWPRRYLAITTGALFFVLSVGGFVLSLLGMAADWIGWSGFFLAPVSFTVLALGYAGPMDASMPPPHPLQVLNNCQ